MDTIETIEHRGYQIHIHPDLDPQNPQTDWDGEPPMLEIGDRGYASEYGVSKTPPALTRDQIKANARDIAAELGETTLLKAVRAYAYHYLDEYATATDAINDAIGEYASSLVNGADITAFLCQCWAWAGCDALDTSIYGFCQGDYADVLVVATSEWLAMTGAPADSVMAQLDGAADIYRAYAFGDVYGYTITDAEGNETDDSCWGFYTSDHETSGLLEDARATIDCNIKYRRRARLSQVRQYIYNRVPLQYRTA